MTLRWHAVAESGEVDGTRPLARRVADIELAILRIDGQIFAVEDRCPHMAHPLHRGEVRDGRLVCSWHGWEFDLPGGQRFANAEARCTTYATREIDGRVEVAIDPDALPDPPGGMPRGPVPT